MAAAPILETERLHLRGLTSQDAEAVHRLAGRREIADTTLSIPHPLTLEGARAWIASLAKGHSNGDGIALGMCWKKTQDLVGTAGLRAIDAEHGQAELGFWVGVDWWGQGLATEAASALVAYGFTSAGINRIYAHNMVRNPASGRVLQKIGMKREGLLRQRVRKWGVFEDVFLWAILRKDWAETV